TRASLYVFHGAVPTVFYTLSLHDALPIFLAEGVVRAGAEVSVQEVGLVRIVSTPAEEEHLQIALGGVVEEGARQRLQGQSGDVRSEEHTSELQSRENLVCRLLLEKKKTKK